MYLLNHYSHIATKGLFLLQKQVEYERYKMIFNWSGGRTHGSHGKE
jgi:hypothetical protein